MFGDFVLWLKQFLKEQTCLHNYQEFFTQKEGTKTKCIKCGRIKK